MDEQQNIFIYSLLFFLGFLLFYLAQKHAYQYHYGKLRIRLTHIRLYSFAALHVVFGFILLFFSYRYSWGLYLGIVFSFIIHMISTAFIYEDHHRWLKESIFFRLFFLACVWLGFALAYALFMFELFIHSYIFALLSGIFVFHVLTDLNPQQKKGHILYFLSGILLYFAIYAVLF
ncbi:MAG: hypothetical protein ACMXYA_01425 [Candidatus Woesearchaeota archaeon]